MSMIGRLQPLNSYRASVRWGRTVATATVGQGEGGSDWRPCGAVQLRRDTAWRHELMAGTIRIGEQTVSVSGSSRDWVWTRRSWQLSVSDDTVSGEVVFPAWWGFFTYTGYAQVRCSKHDVGSAGQLVLDVAAPNAGRDGVEMRYRVHGENQWKSMWLSRAWKPPKKGTAWRMFEDTFVIEACEELCGIVCVAGMLCMIVFPAYMTD